MGQEGSWRRDPFGRHEERYFEDDRPTDRVRDWGFEKRDAPPAHAVDSSDGPPAGAALWPRPEPLHLTTPAQDVLAQPAAASSGLLLVEPPPDPPPAEHPPAPEQISAPTPLQPVDEPGAGPEAPLILTPVPESSSPDSNGNQPTTGTARFEQWRRFAWVGLVVVALAILISAFHGSGARARLSKNRTSPHVAARSGSTSTAAPSSSTSSPTSTTTTVGIPSSPQSSADQAANALISAWAQGNQTKALFVATPQAVSALFVAKFQSGLAIDRGCNTDPKVETCSFGPPGGASPTDPLYSLTVTQAPSGGWYVSAVQIEG